MVFPAIRAISGILSVPKSISTAKSRKTTSPVLINKNIA
jgi:hypothetical protein